MLRAAVGGGVVGQHRLGKRRAAQLAAPVGAGLEPLERPSEPRQLPLDRPDDRLRLEQELISAGIEVVVVHQPKDRRAGAARSRQRPEAATSLAAPAPPGASGAPGAGRARSKPSTMATISLVGSTPPSSARRICR